MRTKEEVGRSSAVVGQGGGSLSRAVQESNDITAAWMTGRLFVCVFCALASVSFSPLFLF
jgi:hypothetical protein